MVTCIKYISSMQNPLVKLVGQLKNRKTRDEQKLILIEGYREVLRAFEGNAKFTTLLYCEELFLGNNNEDLIEKISAEKIAVSKQVFKKLSYRDRPDGILAIASMFKLGISDLEDILKHTSTPLIGIGEAIEKPGNLGSILRSADAAGLDAVIVVDKCTDIYNPNVVRASIGTLFSVPVFDLTSAQTLSLLKKYGVDIVASLPDAQMSYSEMDYTKPIAIAMGTEQLGLSDFWKNASTIHVSIPMQGVADSLNVSNAATILFYEALRQRTTACL